MLEHYKTLHPKPKNSDGLKKALQLKWDQLPQDSMNKVISSFTKTLRACVKARGGHVEFALKYTVTLQVTAHFCCFFEIWNRILYKCVSNFGNNENILVKFSRTVENSFPCKILKF